MLNTILIITGIIASTIDAIVKVIDIINRNKHQKSNRTDQS